VPQVRPRRSHLILFDILRQQQQHSATVKCALLRVNRRRCHQRFRRFVRRRSARRLHVNGGVAVGGAHASRATAHTTADGTACGVGQAVKAVKVTEADTHTAAPGNTTIAAATATTTTSAAAAAATIATVAHASIECNGSNDTIDHNGGQASGADGTGSICAFFSTVRIAYCLCRSNSCRVGKHSL